MSRLEQLQAEQMRVIYEGLRKAKQEENEACAKVAQDELCTLSRHGGLACSHDHCYVAKRIEALIRARFK